MTINSEPNPFTGLYDGSNGGTELLYRAVQNRMPMELFNKIQLICSRPNVLLDKPRILWQHDHASDPPPNFEKREYRNKFNKHVFVSNVQLLMFTMTTGLTYDEAVVIRNAIVPIHEHQKPTDRINLIYHTTPHRGLELLVPAFIEIVKQNPTLPLHLDVYSSFDVYGWSNRDLPYQPLFDMCKDHPNITYHGFKPNHIIREALTKAHIFAYPNIWPETSSLAVIEAMSAGCLVIHPKFEGLIETIGDFGVSYSYCEDKQTHVNRFASTLHQVLQVFGKSQNLINLAQKAKNHTNIFYSWDNRIDEWTNLYESILKNGQNNQKGSY